MEAVFDFVNNNILLIYLLAFLIILGFEVISNVPTVLHTPLMSGSNAISGIVIVGSILIIRNTQSDNFLVLGIASLAIIMGMINVAGGFAVTNRMLEMFQKKRKKKS